MRIGEFKDAKVFFKTTDVISGIDNQIKFTVPKHKSHLCFIHRSHDGLHKDSILPFAGVSVRIKNKSLSVLLDNALHLC